jgi:hypothetical protein
MSYSNARISSYPLHMTTLDSHNTVREKKAVTYVEVQSGPKIYKLFDMKNINIQS